ncbi:hypothetical protein KBY55_24815 [Streptomyces sp. b94]|uniref:hypothetical protein n=1 Tax=Streptomyces sp. b94 TaxID=1827634 RepID=UPI001B396FD2|nr:hypothetical protein [Streptomyces sp. b94]MBQ1099193.1 hypothetical protein [Streptomyces sp. b94]
MTLTRPGPLALEKAAGPAEEGVGPTATPHADLPPLGDGPLSADVVLRARWLEVLLGDPLNTTGPHGRTTSDGVRKVPAPSGALGTVLPGPADLRRLGADGIARVLRPLFRRDLGLGHAWAVRPLSGAVAGAEAGGPGAELGALLGPAALIAAAGGALHTTARLVDSLAAREPGVRQWQPVLAAGFADLLACESLTTVALRALDLTAGGTPALTAATGYVVPQLVGQVLDDLELVLNESGFGPHTAERRALAKLAADRAEAGADPAAAVAGQARLIRALPSLADPAGGGSRPDAAPEGGSEHAVSRELFQLGRTVTARTGTRVGALSTADVAAALPGAAARLAERTDDDPAVAALTRVARRLATEQRTLRLPCPAAGHTGPVGPVARALADRQALLLLAAAVLGVGREAGGFLGGPHWALLALARVTRRLGAPLPGPAVDPAGDVWAELAERTRQGVDCDVYGSELLWAAARTGTGAGTDTGTEAGTDTRTEAGRRGGGGA